jgi:hypothetical protein
VDFLSVEDGIRDFHEKVIVLDESLRVTVGH